MGRVDAIGDAAQIARDCIGRGHESATLHVGSGFESDAESDALVRDILETAERYRFPLYIETHRATITQDPWRTLQLVARFPDIRFNGDFSHWYTGAELVYGDSTQSWTPSDRSSTGWGSFTAVSGPPVVSRSM